MRGVADDADRARARIGGAAMVGARSALGYGVSLLIDLYGCDSRRFSRRTIRRFMVEFCAHIGMEREALHFWDFPTRAERLAAPAHLAGISAVQFITTSNITLHTLDRDRAIFLDCFTCNNAFDEASGHLAAVDFAKTFWRAERSEFQVFGRGKTP